jgi:hypothetical protein
MIHRLEASNFYSLREAQVIDLRVSANVPDLTRTVRAYVLGRKELASKVVALFGPNAAAKSNVLLSVGFLSWFVSKSVLHLPEAFLPYQPFNDSEAQESPTRLGIRFAGPRTQARPATRRRRNAAMPMSSCLGAPRKRRSM